MLRDKEPYYYEAPAAGVAAFKRISWGAIIAGALVAVVVLIMLNLLGTGIGLATINPVEETNPFSGLGTGALIWWIVSNLVALFAGGYVAGRLAGFPKSTTGFLHGFLSWCLFTLFSMYLLTTTVGTVASGVGSILGKTAELAGRGVAAAIPETDTSPQAEQETQNTIDRIVAEAREILARSEEEALDPENVEQTGEELAREGRETARDIAVNPQRLEQELREFWQNVRAEGKTILDAADRETLVNILTRETDMTRSEAERVVERWSTSFENLQTRIERGIDQVGERAEEVSGDVADALAKAAIYSFIALLVGAVSAGVGGAVGSPRDLAVQGESISRTDVKHRRD